MIVAHFKRRLLVPPGTDFQERDQMLFMNLVILVFAAAFPG